MSARLERIKKDVYDLFYHEEITLKDFISIVEDKCFQAKEDLEETKAKEEKIKKTRKAAEAALLNYLEALGLEPVNDKEAKTFEAMCEQAFDDIESFMN